MDKKLNVAGLLAELDTHSPAGFAIALHIQFTSPRFLFQAYPKRWIDIYTKRGLVLDDPTVVWGFKNLGKIRWRDLLDQDSKGVMRQARDFGLVYGFTISLMCQELRTVASFSRTDREFLDAEIDEIEQLLKELATITRGIEALTDTEMQALRKLSIRLTHI